MSLRATILGCGSSGGVPRVGGDWGDCDPNNPRNRRRRCALLVERAGPDGVTRVLIDTGPDLREQLLDADVGNVDAVAYTHAHADHTHGIDDLRALVIRRRARLPVWADAPTSERLRECFGYVFVQPEGSAYPPIFDLNEFDAPFTISGAGGDLTLEPLRVQHGAITALGFRIGGLCYMPDVNEIPDAIWPRLAGLDLWIVDALRRAPHPSHAHLERTLDWITRAAPAKSVITNMHVDMDYDTLCAELPDGVLPAYDGLSIEVPA